MRRLILYVALLLFAVGEWYLSIIQAQIYFKYHPQFKDVTWWEAFLLGKERFWWYLAYNNPMLTLVVVLLICFVVISVLEYIIRKW